MKQIIAYLCAQGKRTLRFYPILLAFTVLMTAGLSALFTGLSASAASTDSHQPITVGLVGDIEGTYLEIGIYAIESFDSSQYYLDFVKLSEEEAAAAVNSGEITAYLYIPDQFVERMIDGEDVDITFVTGNSPTLLGPMLMEEVASVLSDTIIHAQKGVYGLSSVLKAHDVPREERSDTVYEVSLLYADSIFGRQAVAYVDIIGIGGGLGFESYYLCVGVLLLLLLCGVVCAPLLIRGDLSLQRVLRTRGLSAVGQVTAEYIPFAVAMLLTMTLCLTALGVFFPSAGAHVGVTSFTEGLWLALCLVPAIVLLTAWQYTVYELTHHLIGGVLLQVLLTVGLCYASGYLLPLSALPATLQTVAAFLPTGTALFCAAGAVTQTTTAWTLGGAWLYAVLLLVICAWVRRAALEKEGRYA